MANEFDQNAGVLEERLAKEAPGDPVQADTPDLH